jgi:hypothetical protein
VAAATGQRQPRVAFPRQPSVLALESSEPGRPATNRFWSTGGIENRLWGAPRIRGELLKLGFAVAQSTVVCIENLIRIDLVTESLNVGRDGRADIPPFEPGCVGLQTQEPA